MTESQTERRTSLSAAEDFAEAHLSALTPRQREVLDLIADVRSNPDISERLDISLDGAKHHVSEVLTRLGFASREEAGAWWRSRQGIAGVPRRMRRRAPVLLALAASLGAIGASLVVVFVLLGGDDESRDYGPLTPGLWVAHLSLEPLHREGPQVRLFNPDTGEVRLLGDPGNYQGLALAPDGAHVLASIGSGELEDFELRFQLLPVDGSDPVDLPAGPFGFEMSSFVAPDPVRSPDGRYLAWTKDGIVIMDVVTGRAVIERDVSSFSFDWVFMSSNDTFGSASGWSVDSRWFRAAADGEGVVFGVDGSEHPLSAAPAGSEPGGVSKPRELELIATEVLSARPGTLLIGIALPRGTADRAGVLVPMRSMPGGEQSVVAVVDGRQIALDDLTVEAGVPLLMGAIDAVVIR